MIYLYLFGTCFHFIYVFMIIGNNSKSVNGFLGISFPLGGKPKPFSEL